MIRSRLARTWPRWLALLLLGLSLGACGDEERSGGGEGPAGPAWLVDVTSAVGIDFVHDSGLDGKYAVTHIMGSGGAFFDYDGDGDLDVFLVGCSSTDPTRRSRPHALYRQGSDGRFEEVGASAGVAARTLGMGAAVGDYDNDGDLDLLVTNVGPDSLFRNEGDGTFTEVGRAAGLLADAWSMSAAFFDYDGDGFLDVYIATYFDYDPEKVCRDQAGRIEYCGPLAYDGAPDLLYRNNGDGSFSEVARRAGTSSTAGRGLGVMTCDFDGDGKQDVFVANDGVSNFLWINQGDGTFEDRALSAGVAVNSQGKPEASMGVALGDTNGDLTLDLFVTHLDRETNTLYTTTRMTSFQDRTARAGLAADSLPHTGFGTGFFDFENDGDLDLLIVNGRVRRPQGAKLVDDDPLAAYREPNALVLNQGGGRFEYRNDLVGTFHTVLDVSRGLLLGDLDRDGDLDALVTNCNGPARLYRNEAPSRGTWMAVRAITGRRAAVGARIYLRAANRWHVRPVTHTYGYLSGGSATAHFGLGKAAAAEALVVRWPDGSHEGFPGATTGQTITLVRGQGRPAEPPRMDER